MRRGCLLLLLPVGLLLGLAWVTMPTLTQVVSTYVPVQTIAKIVSNPSLPDKPHAAPEKDKPTDAALAPYQPNLRSPFAADLAQQANAPRYEIELSLDADAHKITGQQIVRYVNQTTKPLSDLVLRRRRAFRCVGLLREFGEGQAAEVGVDQPAGDTQDQRIEERSQGNRQNHPAADVRFRGAKPSGGEPLQSQQRHEQQWSAQSHLASQMQVLVVGVARGPVIRIGDQSRVFSARRQGQSI